MESRDVVLLDAFATEPTGGLAAAVVPGGADLTEGQLRAASGELAAPVAVPTGDGRSRVVGPPPGTGDIEAFLAAVVAAESRGGGPGGTWTGPAGCATPREATVAGDGTVWLDAPDPAPERVGADYDRLSAALGVDVAALRDVGADLSPVRVAAGGGALAVPVNFLEHLSGARPDPAALRRVADEAGVEAVCAFTFDTLGDAVAHARTFMADPAPRARTAGHERPVTPATVGGCLAALVARGVVDSPTGRIEQGHFAGRPGLVEVDATEDLSVGGRAVESLTGTISLEDAEDDGIIEA